jgi:hypothetical protein
MHSLGDVGATREARDVGHLRLERVLRALTLLSLGALLLQSLRDAPGASRGTAPRTTDSRGLHDALVQWTARETPSRVHVTLARVPSPQDRDWLTALGKAGTPVTWDGAPAPTAVAVERMADPARGSRVFVAAPAGSRVDLRDALGALDPLDVAAAGGATSVPAGAGVVRARVGDTEASTLARDSLVLRRVLVLGEAAWETKFVAAALAEAGWRVDARFAVAPSGDAVQGAPSAVDTARYSAVVALDSSGARQATAIAAFVRAGGGLVVASSAATIPALRPLLPAAQAIAPTTTRRFDEDSFAPRRALALSALSALASDAVALEWRDGAIAVAAHRAGRGRVLQLGYLDSWRWRMAGAASDAAAAHRSWWSSLVSAVAYAPHFPLGSSAATDPAPYAALVDRLGPPRRLERGGARTTLKTIEPELLRPWVLGLFGVSLLAELALRRMRGAR